MSAMQALADRTGLPLVRWHLLRRQATLAALTGDFAANRRLRAQAAEIAAARQDTSVKFSELAQSIGLAFLRGDPADLAPGWEGQLPAVRSYPAVAQAGLAVALLLAGRRDDAAALALPIIHSVADLRRGLPLAALAYLPELVIELGDRADRLAVRAVMSERFDETRATGAGTVSYEGSVAHTLGELDLACDEPAAAVAHFEQGLRIDSLLGARPYVARGRLGLARALTLTGDHRRAVQLAHAADDARRLDMPGLARAAGTFLATVRAEDPLTPREHEIVDLVAQALTNRAIADRLVLSERTVESHVRRILAKTGLTSRTELARWFLQRQP